MKQRSALAAQLAAAVLLSAAWAGPACAQGKPGAWSPSRNVEIISSTGVGGAQDRLARVLESAIRTHKLTAVPVVVTNKPGGNGALAVAYLNRAPGDGHSLLISSALMLSSHIMGRSSFNYTDMSPIAQMFNEYAVLVVKSDSPLKTGGDFIARLKAAPDSVSIGVTVLGTAHHLSIARAAKSAGVDPKRLKMVTFKSGTDALIATMGGHVDTSVASVSNMLGQLEAGAARAIAVSAPRRMTGVMANVPTWKELGYDSVASNFRMVFGPQGLSPAQVAYWEQIMQKISSSPEWTKEVESNAWVNQFLNTAQSKEALASEYEMLKGMLTELGMAKQ